MRLVNEISISILPITLWKSRKMECKSWSMGRSARECCPLHMPWLLCSWTHCSYGYLDVKWEFLGNLRALRVGRLKNIVYINKTKIII